MDKEFDPMMDTDLADKLMNRWHEAVKRSRGWEEYIEE